MKDVLLKIAESCYDEETTIDDEGNITGGRLTFNKDKFITEIADIVKAFIEWKEKMTDKVDDKYLVIKKYLTWRIIWEDVEFKTLSELFNYWYNEIREK